MSTLAAARAVCAAVHLEPAMQLTPGCATTSGRVPSPLGPAASVQGRGDEQQRRSAVISLFASGRPTCAAVPRRRSCSKAREIEPSVRIERALRRRPDCPRRAFVDSPRRQSAPRATSQMSAFRAVPTHPDTRAATQTACGTPMSEPFHSAAATSRADGCGQRMPARTPSDQSRSPWTGHCADTVVS